MPIASRSVRRSAMLIYRAFIHRVCLLCELPLFSFTRVWTSQKTGTRACSDRFTRSLRVRALPLLFFTHTRLESEFFFGSVGYYRYDPENRLLQRQNKTWWKSPKELQQCLLIKFDNNTASYPSPSRIIYKFFLSTSCVTGAHSVLYEWLMAASQHWSGYSGLYWISFVYLDV